jgi:hypothetical protein|nr:MAG TPA: Morphogenesis protein 1 wall, phi29, hydrolase, infection [Caudoviricetes sp.]
MALIKDKIKQQNKEEYAYKKMLSYGWTPDQAAGIVGNLIRESNLNTTILGTADTKGSKGIAQWHSGRLETLQNKYGSNWTDLDNQLDFVNWELNNTHKKAGDKLRTAQGVYNTGRIVSDDYERPKVKFHADTKRQNLVFNTYKKLSGTPLTDSDRQQFLKGTAQRAIDSYIPATNEVPITYTPEVSNFISPINIPTLAEPNETEAVQKAKEELDNKQQQQLNQQRFIQDLLVASQVQYVDPNQVQQEVTYPDSEQYYQKGGTYYDLPMNNPVIRNNITPKQFSLDYINSSNYKQRLKNSGYKNINEEIGIRRQNVEDVNINNERPFTIMSKLGFSNRPPAGSHFNGEDINLDFEYDKEKMAELYPKFIPPSKNETLAHELTHAQLFDQDNPIVKNRLNSYDLNQLTRRLKDNKSDKNTSHDILPDENKADLDAYRYILKRDGVYDTNTEEFTKEHLKLPTKSFTKQRLLKNYKEDDLIWLMNNIAQNEENDLIYAQNGGSIQNSQEFLKNWYPNRVLPDSSLNSTYQAEKNLYLNQAQTLPVPNYVNQIDTENTQGTYDINTNQINLLNTANPLVYTHEATHAINLPLKDTQSNVNAFNIIGQNVIPRENIQNEWVKQNYPQISNYQEIIPRLNAYRQKYNLQPTQVITPELIQQNRQQYINTADFEDNTDQLYKLFENEGLSNVLNKVVSVDNSSQYYGEKGGVIRDDQGYWNPDNWGKIVEINSNNISMQNVKQPLIGVSNETGEARLMIPGKEYIFSSTKKVTEYPTKRNKNKRFS